MPGFIGLPEILLLGLVALLVFGPKRLPEMGRSLGQGLRSFKESVGGDADRDRTLKAIIDTNEGATVAFPDETPDATSAKAPVDANPTAARS